MDRQYNATLLAPTGVKPQAVAVGLSLWIYSFSPSALLVVGLLLVMYAMAALPRLPSFVLLNSTPENSRTTKAELVAQARGWSAFVLPANV